MHQGKAVSSRFELEFPIVFWGVCLFVTHTCEIKRTKDLLSSFDTFSGRPLQSAALLTYVTLKLEFGFVVEVELPRHWRHSRRKDLLIL